MRSSACSTVLRRFVGPEASKLAILCRPNGESADTVPQAEAAYRALAEILAAHEASFGDLTCETLFLRDIRRELPVALDTRARILTEIGENASAPAPAFIGQSPVAMDTCLELAATAVVPHRRDTWSVRDVRAKPSCGCEGCARSGARIVRLDDRTSLHTTNVYGTGTDAASEVWNMFCAAERLLVECGMGFGDVVRTWIHLRHIDRDYDALNRARREFFRDRGIERRPASTGIEGTPLPDAHDFSLSFHAVTSRRPLDITRMSTPTLNEAWTYGADFSRGLRLTDANETALYISGTASIDEAGRTVHVGNFAAQADRMLRNIDSLLVQQGASFENLFSGVAYLKNPDDAALLRAIFHERGFDEFPCAMVEGRLCRPDLLCETEVVALLPLAVAGV